MSREPAAALALTTLAALCGVRAAISYDGGFTGVLVAVGLLAAVAVTVTVVGLRARLATVGGRRITVHTHGGHGTRLAARHEGGHVAVTRAVGGRVTGAQIFPDGSGYTELQLPRGISVVDRIAVDVAGEVAARSRWGCSSDQAYMRDALRSVPPSERAAVKRAGYARARQITGGIFSDGGVGAIQNQLLKKGHL